MHNLTEDIIKMDKLNLILGGLVGLIALGSLVVAVFALKRSSKKEDNQEIQEIVDLKIKNEALERQVLEGRVDSIEKITDKQDKYIDEIFNTLKVMPAMSATLDLLSTIVTEIRNDVKNVGSKMLSKDEHRELHRK